MLSMRALQVAQQPPEELRGTPKMAPVWKNALAWGSFMSVFANVSSSMHLQTGAEHCVALPAAELSW